MLRVVTVPSGGAGFVQVIPNTADARLQGFELEVTAFLTESLLLSTFVGYVDGDYTDVIGDLDGDTLVTARDEALGIPRLAQIFYGATLDYVRRLPSGGEFGVLPSYNYRDESESVDSNAPGTIVPERETVSANVSYTSADEKWGVSLYGKNLLDEHLKVVIADLPGVVGGGMIAPLEKGRTGGLEFSYSF